MMPESVIPPEPPSKAGLPERLLFILIAVVATIPAWATLDSFPAYATHRFPSTMTMHQTVEHMLCRPLWQSLWELLHIQVGTTFDSGTALFFNVFLWPFFGIFGVSYRAISITSIACHLLFALGLWTFVRSHLPGRSTIPFALVFFASPWYRSTMFSQTQNSISIMILLFTLIVFFHAMEKRRTGLLVLAGFVLGFNLYGFIVCRVFPFLCLAVAFANWAWHRIKRSQGGITGKGLLALAASIPLFLGINLLDPEKTFTAFSFYMESAFQEHYWHETGNIGKEFLEIGLFNASSFFHRTFRLFFQPPWFTQLLFGLFGLGAIATLVKREQAGLSFIFFSITIYLSVSFLTASWTWGRTGTIGFPILMVCGIGLDSFRQLLSYKFPTSMLSKAAAWLALLAFAFLTIGPNRFFENLEIDSAPHFDVARELTDWPGPLKNVVATGDENFVMYRLRATSMELAQVDRINDLCHLEYTLNPLPDHLDRIFKADRLQTAFIVFQFRPPASWPQVELEVWREDPGRYTIYRATNKPETE